MCLLLCLAALTPAQITKGKVAPRDLPFTPINKWALVIGASDYKELGKLNYAAKDAEAFANVLKERFEFNSESIELITDNPDSTQKPTIERIEQALDRQLEDKRLSKGDLFIFYFSGHGIGTPKGDFLMPTDATAAEAEKSGQNVKEIVEKFVKAGLRNVLVIVDACRGGDKNDFGDDLRKLGKEANIAVLLGCEPGARSYEYPRLGHGAFTSFLIKSLKSTELQSETTGALWASKIVADVGTKVRDYTIRDYPNQPQTPTGWAEPTMDVLLGAFPRKGAARLKLADLMAETERLGKEDHIDSLRRFAYEMREKGLFAEAIETFRTIASISVLDPNDSFLMALDLGGMGKTFEMQNQLAKLSRGPQDSIYTHFALMYDPSRSIKPTERVAAAKRVWNLQKVQWTGMVCWASLQIYASSKDVNGFLTEFLALQDLDPKFQRFLEGQYAANEGKWDEADKKWEQCDALAGDFPDEMTLGLARYTALFRLGNEKRLEAMLTNLVQKANKDGSFSLLLARYYQEKQQFEKVMAALNHALDRDLTPDQLLLAIRISGLRFPEIKEKIVKLSDRTPYAWKAMLAKLWVTAKGEEAIADAMNQASKYCDDEFAVAFECFQLLDGQLDEVLARGAMTPEKYSELMVAYSSIMAQNVEKFGYEAQAWMLFNKFAVNAEKLEQVSALYAKYLGPRLEDGTLDKILIAPYLFVALQVDDLKRVEQLWGAPGMPASERLDAQWLVSMYHAVRGDTARAKELLPSQLPSQIFHASARAYKAYLAVKSGEKVDIAGLIPSSKSSGSAMHWLALCYVELKQWDKAMPILDEFIFQRQQGFFFLQAKASEAYFGRMLANKQFEKANEFAYNIAISGFGNPIYTKIHFGSAPSLAQFKGEIDLEAAEFDLLPEMDRGSAKITIDGSGNVTGNATLGDKVKAISGKVDQYGNLKATVTEGDKTWTMTGKIAPPALYKTLPNFKTNGQIFLLLDNNGQARYLIGRPRA